MAQYFGGFEEEEDDPVLFELDVYLSNPTLSDILGYFDKLPEHIPFLNELASNPFDRLLLLQYPLETCKYLNGESSDGIPRNKINSNASDMLKLKSVEIGEQVENNEVNNKKIYVSKSKKSNRHYNSPFVKFNYDLGPNYALNVKTSPIKKSHKSSLLFKKEFDAMNSPEFGPSKSFGENLNVLTYESSVSTSEHVMDCLGLLKIENTEHGLKRELHLVPVRAILQLRPKLDSFNQSFLSSDDSCMSLFYNKNLTWKGVDKIYYSESPESMELIEQFIKYGKEVKECDNPKINFNQDRELYINSLCVPLNGTSSGFQRCSKEQNGLVNCGITHIYTKTHDFSPNFRFMKRLSLEMQLKLLLSHRSIDSFYSLKRDIVNNNLEDEELIKILAKFAKNISGNWVLSSVHAIENYTEDDECNPEEMEYLVSCREFLLCLLNRQSSEPKLKDSASVCKLATEIFRNATGLPFKLANDLLCGVAKPQGKIWVLKLDKDEEFSEKHTQVFDLFNQYWRERLKKIADIVSSFKKSPQINQMLRNIFIKGELASFIKNKVCSHYKIMEHMESLGYGDQQETINGILPQVATRINDGLWTCKKANAWFTECKNNIIGTDNQAQIPNFIVRAIKKFTD
uniref:Sin-like protein conserved region containing protein, putative n=1 Tax=Theileria annulata TaxID=5874 RepID=A0A3B0MPJ3_THEAN